MNGAVIAALAALAAPQQTDTTFAAGEATRLEVEAPGGSITVTGWDRSELAVTAEHSSRTYVEIRRSRDGRTIEVEAEARRGPATIVDYRISAPRSLALELDGTYADVTVEGMNGAVEVDVAQGDVAIRGGRGSVKVSSATGKVRVEGAEGRVDVETAAGEIRFVDVAGEIVAESAAGDIVFENVRATSVDAGTVGGRVHYDGTYQAAGTYFFGSHGGSVTLVVPEGTSATFRLATIHGTVVDGLSGQPQRSKGGERHTLEVGGGGALVEAETFAGRISLVRPGGEGSEAPSPRRGGGFDGFALPGELAELMGSAISEVVSDAVSAAVPAVAAGALSGGLATYRR